MATMTNLDFPTCSPVELLEVQHEHAWTGDHAVHHAGHPCHFFWVAFLHIFAHWFDWCYFTQRNCSRRRRFHVWWGPFETDNEAHWNAKRQCSATVQCAGDFCRPLEGWASVEPCGVTWYWRCSERKSAPTKFVIETMARWNVWLGPWRWTPCWPSGLQPDLSFTRGFHDKAGKNMCSVVDFPCHGDHDEPGLSDLQSRRASWGTAWTCMNKGPCRAACRSSMSFFSGGIFAYFRPLIRLMLLHAEKLSKTQTFSRMMGAIWNW